MSIFLSHTTALEVLRRWDSFRLLDRGQQTEPLTPPRTMPSPSEVAWALEHVPALQGISTPLHVLVVSAEVRHRCELAVPHVALAEYPAEAFFSLAPGVLCSSPELVMLQMAEYATDLELLLLADELCGLYAIQPKAQSRLVMRQHPLTSTERTRGFLGDVGTVRGSRKLLRALERTRTASGSPRESKTAHRLDFSSRQGGYGLEIVDMNRPLTVERADALLGEARTRIRKPDILLLAPEGSPSGSMPFRGVALEYNGSYHSDRLQQARDANRRNELLAYGIKDYEIEKEHYADRGYFDWLASMIRRDLGISEPRLSQKAAQRSAQRRDRLWKALENIDGLSWTNRETPLLMEGSRPLPSA